MLGDISANLGPPPTEFVQEVEGNLDDWKGEGKLKAQLARRSYFPIEDKEFYFYDEEKSVKFMAFIRKMLKWRPEERLTARELLKDEWLNGPDLHPRWEALSMRDQVLGKNRVLPQHVELTDEFLREGALHLKNRDDEQDLLAGWCFGVPPSIKIGTQ